jgi:hypothetical protein
VITWACTTDDDIPLFSSVWLLQIDTRQPLHFNGEAAVLEKLNTKWLQVRSFSNACNDS